MPAQFTTRTCEWCGAAFEVPTRNLRFHAHRFCTVPCSDAALSAEHNAKRLDRFWVNVDKEDCWKWTGSRFHGYGQSSVRIGGIRSAHIIAWTLASGLPVPDGIDVCHTCDRRECVKNDEPGIYIVRGIARPRFGHLFLGTHLDNMADMVQKGRSLAGDRNNGRRWPERMRHGEAHYRAKMTEDTVREIRRMLNTGTRQTYIADHLRISKGTVSKIATGVAWKHVT